MIKCPNTNHKDWKAIVNKYGEDTAWASYIAAGEAIPSLADVETILGDTFVDTQESLKDTAKENIKIVETVNKAIIEQLESMGVGIGVLEEFQNIHGVFDPQGAKDAATGLVNLIKVAKGEEGVRAIPEEYAHLVDAVLRQNDSPIYKRLINLLSDEDLIREVFEREEVGSYDTYFGLYGGNMQLLAAEARAKLIAKHIVNNESIKQSPWSALLSRVKNLFKRIFSRGDQNKLATDLAKADTEYSQFTVKLLDGTIPLNFNLDGIRGERLMYNAKQEVTKAGEVYKHLVELRARQLKIDEQNLTNKQISDRENVLARMETMRTQNRNEEGILLALDTAIEDFENLRKQTQDYKVNANTSDNQLAKLARHLRSAKAFVNAYEPLSKSVSDYMQSDEYKQGEGIDYSESLKALNHLINEVHSEYRVNSLPLFREFIKRFSGSLIGSVVNGKVFTEEMLNRLLIESDKDIGFAEMLLFSMSNSSDLMLRLIERPIKEKQWEKRIQVNEIIKDLQKAQENLEAVGGRTDFMFERDSKGIPTGYWIKPFNDRAFDEAHAAKKEELVNKYGKPLESNPKKSLYDREYFKWREQHIEKDGTPNRNIYPSEAFNSWNKQQRDFYDTILNLKKELMNYLPENQRDLYLAPQYRKDFLDILRDSKGIEEAASRYRTLIGDQFIDREADDEFGMRHTIKNFDDTRLETLPIYYTQKLDNPGQLSMDVVSTMALYTDMALTYKHMSEIVDLMEIGRDLMKERSIQDTKGGKGLMEQIKSAGRTITSKVIKPTDSTNFMSRLNDFYSNQLYGITTKDEGSFKLLFTQTHISIAKAANQLNKYTAMNTYAFNFLGGVANIATGLAMTRLEAIAGQYLGVKESAKADRLYAKMLPDIISDLGRRRHTTLPSLLFERFNTFQDYEESLRSLRMNKKNLFGRYITGSSAFFLNTAGEHYLAAKIFLAMAERYKLKQNGKEIPLHEAFEVVKDSKGIERLQLKQGVTKSDGTEFTMKDQMMFSRKVAKMHQNLHGIYNREDMSMFQRTALGRMAFMFRKWMPTAWSRRFSKENYDFDLDDVTEGFYRGFGRFMTTLAKDLKQGHIDIAANWKKMSTLEKANVKRALTEISTWLATIAAYALLSNAWDDDDSWYKNFLLYQIRRHQTEIGTLVPTGYSQLTEGFRILQSPAAAMDYTQHLFNVVRIWDLWAEPLQSGQYEGWNRYARNVVRPLPYHNSIRRALNPEEALKFFQMY